MIKFTDGQHDIAAILNTYRTGSPEYEFLSTYIDSSHEYIYSSQEELIFETSMRRNIIDASTSLYRGRLAFRIFQESKCNEKYWNRRSDGGFVLREDVKSSDGVADIFANTHLYGTECATAVVIIYYKAVLDSLKANLFDSAFQRIVLMNWRDMDELINVSTYRGLPDYVPGDCRYVRNPDVNPLTPEWQGENVISLGSNRYYGHGIGTGNIDYFIRALNRNRIEDSQISAYLMDSATRPDFDGLYRYWKFAS
jgi:protein-glutamine gamma-glutamyltransferase